MKQIPLTQSKFAIVDDADFEWLNQWKWHAIDYRNICYAFRSVRIGKNIINVRMHREILSLEKGDGKQVDHINHNGLDNRRCNLRTCTHTDNHHNQRRLQQNCSSKFKGVSWQKNRQKWQSLIRLNGKRIFLGLFNSEIDAAKAYDIAARKYFGEFAYFNFPKRKSA